MLLFTIPVLIVSYYQVLQVIGCKDQIAEDLSIDNFIAEFRLVREFMRTP